MRRSTGVEEAIRRFYERFSANDVDSFAADLSGAADAMVIGTGPAEWLAGRDTWIAGYGEQIAAIPGIRVTAGEPVGWEEGDVGWVADRPSFVLPDGTAVQVRLTAVLLREGGDWKPVQAHFSLGVPDDVMMEILARGAA